MDTAHQPLRNGTTRQQGSTPADHRNLSIVGLQETNLVSGIVLTKGQQSLPDFIIFKGIQKATLVGSGSFLFRRSSALNLGCALRSAKLVRVFGRNVLICHASSPNLDINDHAFSTPPASGHPAPPEKERFERDQTIILSSDVCAPVVRRVAVGSVALRSQRRGTMESPYGLRTIDITSFTADDTAAYVLLSALGSTLVARNPPPSRLAA
jgi:hypothetical protein